jgi:hypothetical protein
MKYLFILIISSVFLGGCTKESTLTDLEINKWEADVPSYINVDSTYTTPANPSDSDISLFLSFNESSIEQEWSNISAIYASYQKVKFGTLMGTPVYRNVSFNNGKAIFKPNNTTNNTTYNFHFYIEFDNGRATAWSPVYQLTTPPF